MSPVIRPIVLGDVRRGEELLVYEGYDPGDDATFYRPLGGGIEFGERGEAALRREFDEELGVSLTEVGYVETYENVFSFDGDPHHELVRLYEARIVEDWPYERDRFTFTEPETGGEHAALWKHPDDFREGDVLYPRQMRDAL